MNTSYGFFEHFGYSFSDGKKRLTEILDFTFMTVLKDFKFLFGINTIVDFSKRIGPFPNYF